MYTSTKKKSVDTQPKHFISNDRLSRPPVQPARHDVRVRTGDNTGIVQRMKAPTPGNLGKLLVINTLADLNKYYQLQNEHYHTGHVLPIVMNSFTSQDPTITEDEVNAAISKLGGPIDPQTDINEIVRTIIEIRSEGAEKLQEIYNSTQKPRPHKAHGGQKGDFVGNESRWHIHLVKDDTHLKKNTDIRTRIDLHTIGGQEYKPEDLCAAATSLLKSYQDDDSARTCYLWLWCQLYEQKSDVIRALPLPERKM